jgi:hypothetical protein
MMAVLWIRKREIGEEDKNNWELTSGYVTSGVYLA